MNEYITIVVPVLNGEKTIKSCLDSIFEVNYPEDKYEVIVVDNGSKDNTLMIAGGYNVKLYIKPEVTISALRNFGTLVGKGNIFAFVDADCLVSKNWIQMAISHFQEERVGIIGSHYKIPENCNWVGNARGLMSEKKNINGEIDYLPGGNMLISRNCFESINGFDESLITDEDVDLCYRANKAGFRIYSDPMVSVVHLGDCISLLTFLRKEIWRGREVVRLYIRDRRKINLKSTLYAISFSLIIVSIFGSLLLSFHTKRINLFLFFCGALFFIPFALSIRSSIRQKRMKYFFHVMTIYLIFGIARAIAIFKMIIMLKGKMRKIFEGMLFLVEI
jgi:GT2 family glycosyltransferase